MKINDYLSIFCSLLLSCIFGLTLTEKEAWGTELKPQWQTSATYTFVLSVRDKWNLDKTYKAKYVVKTSSDLVFVVEREGVAMDSNSAEVTFPDDFSIPETGKKAWIKYDGDECVWEIYVNNVLMENGTFTFTRSRATTK